MSSNLVAILSPDFFIFLFIKFIFDKKESPLYDVPQNLKLFNLSLSSILFRIEIILMKYLVCADPPPVADALSDFPLGIFPPIPFNALFSSSKPVRLFFILVLKFFRLVVILLVSSNIFPIPFSASKIFL